MNKITHWLTNGHMSRRPYFYFKAINWFNYFLVSEPNRVWGYGILQCGSRHLFFVGFCGVSIFYIGKTK